MAGAQTIDLRGSWGILKVRGSTDHSATLASPIRDMHNTSVPDYLSHYYEFSKGPFLSLSRLPLDEAERVMDRICQAGVVFASKRAEDYLQVRRELEAQVRRLFVERGGKPQLEQPHYMILGSCPWVKGWYVDGREVRMPLAAFDPATVSFTYGDTFPAMRLRDGKPYRGRVYRLDELAGLIRAYGLPQEWNPDGRQGPDRYIETQVWDDEPIRVFLARDEASRIPYSVIRVP